MLAICRGRAESVHPDLRPCQDAGRAQGVPIRLQCHQQEAHHYLTRCVALVTLLLCAVAKQVQLTSLAVQGVIGSCGLQQCIMPALSRDFGCIVAVTDLKAHCYLIVIRPLVMRH